ncbi:MAG: ABC transporter substrate-binding protein [Gemmatimonas sp.]
MARGGAFRRRVPWLVAGLALAAAAAAHARTVADVAQLAAPDRQRVLEDGARTEGRVLLYTSLVVQQAAEPLKAAFEKRYPFVKLDFLRANSAQLLQRILAENRAGGNRSDVVIAGAGPAIAATGFAQPFRSPPLAAYPPDHIGPDGVYAATRFSYQGIAYNTRLVRPEEAPQTYEDLADPKWRGRMVWSTSPETGAPFFITQVRQFMGEDRAVAYLEALARQNIATQSASLRAVLDQVIAGEYAIGISMALHHIAISEAKGAPVGGTMPDPVMARAEDILLLKAAPHPHAAMLLIDFVLSEDGQRMFAEAQYFPAHPGVPPLPEMRAFVPATAGRRESIIDDATMERERPRSNALFQQLFK